MRIHGRRVIGNVAHPLAAVPRDARAGRVPRLAVEVGRRPVVHDAPVERPAPSPVGIKVHAGRVVRLGVLDPVPPLHEIARIEVAAGVDPVAGGRGAVVLEQRKRGHLLAGRQVLAVDLLGDLVELRFQGVLVVEGDGLDRVGELAALGLVELLHALEDVGQDPVVVARLTLRWQHLLLPLRPAPAVDEGAVLLDPVGRGDHEDLCLHLARIDAGRAPELRAGRRQGVHHHQPLQVAERVAHLVAVRPDAGGGHAGQDQALHLSLERLVVDGHPGRVAGRLGDEVESELVVLLRRVPIPGLERADHEVAVVGAEEVPRVLVRLLGCACGHVVGDRLLPRGGDLQIAGKDLP